MNPRDIEDVYELSPLQQGMLFHSLRHPRSGVYVEQLDATLAGNVDPDALASAWQEVVDRHPALRTSFHWQEIDKPLQVVHRNVLVRLERLDWSLLTPERLERDLEARQRFDRERGFDLARPPLLRLALIRQPGGTHRLLWTYHHLLLDGWSLSLVLEEVFALYGARRLGEPVRLPSRPPYAAYVRWLQGRDPAAAEAYWRRALAGLREPTPLPLARAAADLPGDWDEGWHGEREVRLTAAASEALTAFARRHGLTLNTVLHGAWALLLSRYTGRQEVVFGSVVSGRPPELPGAEAMLGLFINTLPVRVEVAPERELAPWLQEFQTRQAEAREHGHAALSDLRRWSGLPAGAPLFETLLVFENFPAGTVEGFATAGLEVREVRFQERSDLPLALESAPERELYLRTGHDRRRFGDAEIDRLLGHLRNLLEGLAAARRLDEVPVLSPAERRQIVAAGNGPVVAWPPAGVVDLFAAQAVRTPEAVAVAGPDGSLSYEELDERSSLLAARLAAAGVGPETVVGLLGRRGAGFLAAVLGIFKAGGAYLPLDPRHPPARQARMLARAGCPVVFVAREYQAALEEALAVLPEAPRTLGFEETGEGLEATAPAPPPRPARDPRHLAYVIFTSGSTGDPKGALLAQGGLLNHLRAKVADLGLGPADIVAQTAAQSFDMSVWQLLAPLLAGARVEVFEDEVAFDANRLLPEAARRGVTVLDVVPSLLRAVSEAAAAGTPARPSLRWVVTGGEALPPDVVRSWLARFPGVPLVNAYGPTECTDTVSQHVLRQAPREGEARVPIGRPLTNLRLAVVDRGMRLVPPGAAGELCVGGPALARGYLGDPAATARAFVPDPFSAVPGERLYRTGDLAHRGGEGELEILGRLDHQLKIRGYRIEPGEVEAALRRRPEVADCAVVARESAAGPRLVAYVVGRDGAPADPAALAERLAAALRSDLPEPLVPAAFVPMKALPLTPNGKLDRAALPEPEVRPGAAYVAPRTPIEERLARLFAEILGAEGGAERVGVHDDFFALGGHSLLAMRLAARVSVEWDVPLSLPDLFARPTVAGLGLHIAESRLREAAAGDAAALLDEVRGLSEEELDELLRQEAEAVEEGR